MSTRTCVTSETVRPVLSVRPRQLEHVVERLLNLVADGALRVRDAAYQRDDVHPRDRAGDFRAQHDEAHLRTVAVGNQHLPALLDDVGDVFHRLAQRKYWSSTCLSRCLMRELPQWR